MNMSCYVPLDILRKLPYECRIPESDGDDMELFREDVSDFLTFGKKGIPFSDRLIPRK